MQRIGARRASIDIPGKSTHEASEQDHDRPNPEALRDRLSSQAEALVAQGLGTADPHLINVLLTACSLLEESSHTDTPMVALEQDVHLEAGTYHLFVRRLSSSNPPGKFQVLITRDLASGLMY